MSELKAGVIRTPHNEGMSFDGGSDHISVEEGETEFYLKSEVDGEIARLNKKLDIYKRGFREVDRINVFLCKSVRHQKYKRCVAMAKWCKYWANYWKCCEPPDCSLFIAKAKYYRKWQKRWLKIAEQFKENKNG